MTSVVVLWIVTSFILLHGHAVSRLWRPQATSSPPWERQISDETASYTRRTKRTRAVAHRDRLVPLFPCTAPAVTPGRSWGRWDNMGRREGEGRDAVMWILACTNSNRTPAIPNNDSSSSVALIFPYHPGVPRPAAHLCLGRKRYVWQNFADPMCPVFGVNAAAQDGLEKNQPRFLSRISQLLFF
jgi:hypothetical protein